MLQQATDDVEEDILEVDWCQWRGPLEKPKTRPARASYSSVQHPGARMSCRSFHSWFRGQARSVHDTSMVKKCDEVELGPGCPKTFCKAWSHPPKLPCCISFHASVPRCPAGPAPGSAEAPRGPRGQKRLVRDARACFWGRPAASRTLRGTSPSRKEPKRSCTSARCRTRAGGSCSEPRFAALSIKSGRTRQSSPCCRKR